MKKIYLLGLLFTGLFSNCSNEDIVESSQPVMGNYVIDATIGKPAARTAVDADFNVRWSKGNQIGVYGKTTTNVPFTLIGEGGLASGQFAGTFNNDTPVYAYYPYSEGASISNKTLTMNLPSEYAYTSDSNGPMVAIYTGNCLSFKHLCGLLKVTVNQIPATATKFVLIGSSAIAGAASVADITGAEAVLALSESGTKTITVNLSEAAENNKEFYFPLPVGTYETLTVALCDGSGNTLYTKTASSVKIARAAAVDMQALDASIWDGKSKVEPKQQDGVYQIATAAELAWFQGDANHASSVAELPVTITANAKLLTNIDLGNYPWVGMILGENIEFDGGEHTVSNVTVNEPSLLQSSTNQYACAGLFGATKADSKIKNITVDKVTIAPSGNKNIKWVGGLLGYSYGSIEFTNCHANNITIAVDGNAAIRVGGLIGYIEKYHATLEPSVVLTNCSASQVNITANYSYGGLIGSFWDSVKLENCMTSDITLNLGTSSVSNYGYISKFIGDVANTTSGVARKIIINNCQVDTWTDGEMAALNLNTLKDKAGNSYTVKSLYVGIVDVPQEMSIITDGIELISGIDFNYYEGAATWDGISKVKPIIKNNTYLVTTAAELAWFQSEVAPVEAKKENLEVTVGHDVVLCADIDLANKPWLGMVVSGNKFDGNDHTISNLNLSEYILNQQATTFTPEACVGLFAAVYGASAIENITLNGVMIKPSAGKSPKWVGSLVGYSKGTGTTYTNCIAKNVEILTKGQSSYRVGGLIGYIEKSLGTAEATAILTGCKVETASIAASFSYGGLVGSLYDSVTFTDCHTSGITLSLNGDCTKNLGYVSKFIGDVTNNTTHNRVITITNCSAELLTEAEQTSLSFGNVASQQGKTGTYTPVSPFVGIVDYPAQMTIKVDNNTLVDGTDYNKYIVE